MSAIKLCQICGSIEWWDLPNPDHKRSITTAGRILDEPLGKAQCAQCGLVQRIHAQFLGFTDYYEEDYANYYDRPGTIPFHIERYRVFARWMTSILKHFAPTRILDVGCGQGWAMQAMQELYPLASIAGLEPSQYNSRVARQKGLMVYEGRLGDVAIPGEGYHLVYSTNVIQHVTNARDFLVLLKGIVRDEGAIIVTCPDGSLPNIELLWADQNFSFLPGHLLRLCKDIGFEIADWFASPPSSSVPPAQMLFLSNNREIRRGRRGMEVPISNPNEAYRSKCSYLRCLARLDAYLCSRTEPFARVFNFGASYWSSILAAYCPHYWQKVSDCLVDGVDSAEKRFLEKRVSLISTIEPTVDDVLVLGTSPTAHMTLSARLSSYWKNIILWNEFLSY